jgi:Cu/Ag efflux pump CusA
MGGSITEANEGDYFIRLKPQPRLPIDQVMNELRQQIETRVPGLDIDMALLMEDLIGDLTAVPQPIEIKLYGDDYTRLLATAPKVAQAIGAIAGVVDVRSGVVLAGDAVIVEVARDKAALEGVDPDWVRQQLTNWYDGAVATQIQQGIKLIGIRVWVAPSQRATLTQLPEIWLRAPDGHRFPLQRVATIRSEAGQPQISRENLKRGDGAYQ